ncbi:conserved exported hypothetical protein [Tenacibaculum litoreum]|uniref:fibronectin type III domain-containing protein n=1 Tax=Tenacibaculum litoreum TaxID=321269 RepID=UPI0038943C55
MKRKLLFATFLLVFFNSVFAQQFPVSIIPRVKAPAPVNFYNYADDTSLNSPITVQIFLNDLTIPNRQIRLKTYFEGGNIRFSSKDFVVGAQDLFLEGGIPLTLRNTELAPYYKLENIQGISTSVYGQTIPEGSYNFCFEVYDYISGAKLSAKKCTTVFIFKNEPPILNIPLTGSNIEPTDFENIIFQWTPRHINVSNVEYEFSIVEVWDNSVNPQTAFLSQIPIYEETTRRTSLIYGPDKPLLLPGKKYAWRVRAKALQGLEEIGLFKNQGYSEVFWFSRTAPCQVPEGISAEAKGTSKINVFWEQDPTVFSEYIIAYRENGKANANWFTKRTNSSWATIWNLKPGTTYEYKVKGKCNYQFSDYSELQYVTTDLIQNEDANYNCGIVPDEIAISNRNPHTGLTIGDEVTAGDFKVIITEIQSQSNGRISGKGYVAIPYLKFAKFGVTFSNILINTANQLAEGEIVTLYDPEFGKGASADVDVDVDISDGINGDDGVKDDLVEVDFVIDEVKIDANGAVVVTGTNGEEAIIPGDDDISIKSANGDIWSVGEDGTVTKEEGAEGGAVANNTTNGIDEEGNVNAITATGVTVVFQESGDYYFDALPENTSTTFEKEYKVLEANGTKYKVPYKAISDIQGEDFITAKVTINDTSISKEDIIFKTKDGAKAEVTWNNSSTEATLKLKRKFDYADEEIFAVVKSKEDNEKYDIAGSLITTHLASKELEAINVTLIPVGDGVVINDALKEKTAEIYSKAGVRLNIQTGQSILPDEVYGWDKDGNKRLKVGDSSILSHYTDEQLMFNNYVKQQEYYTDRTYYVFVTNISITNANVSGFMPLKRQFGFVFTQNATTETKQSRTLAHELGHGIFGLEHTWDEYQFGQGATNFLMDYGSGTTLNHLDWKKMHAPGVQLYWFQGDKDGEYRDDEFIDKVFQIIQCAYINSEDGYMKFNTNIFGKKGKYSFRWNGSFVGIIIGEGTFEGQSVYEPVRLTKAVIDNHNPGDRFSLLYKNVEIYTPRYDSGASPETLKKLKEYLFPEDKSEIERESRQILAEILNENKQEFTEEDFEKIKSIANCGVQYFTAKERYEIIARTIKYLDREKKWVTEYYEDLFLDLIETAPKKGTSVWAYSNNFLEYLLEDIGVFQKLFMQLSDDTAGNLWVGNEDNFTRFIGAIYKLWAGSKYADTDRFKYIERITNEGSSLTPYWIHYDGNSWFPKVSYENPVFLSDGFTIKQKKGSKIIADLKFEYYQPIQITFEGNSDSKVTKVIPAIFFGGTIKKDNLSKSLDQAGLAFDVALTLTAIGNFTKLRHLSTLHKVGRVTMGTVDITNSFLSMMVKYGDLEYCQKNKEFCNTFLEYSTYLQLGLMGGGIIDAKITASRIKTKELYESARGDLDDADEIKKVLDEHFAINVSTNWLENLPSKLKNDLAENKLLEDLFKKATNFQRQDLIEAWKVLEDFPKIRIIETNLEVLAKVSPRFSYKGEASYQGLKKLFTGAESKQKLINGLEEADKLFDINLPVSFSGIKKGDVTVNLKEEYAKVIDQYGRGDEVARYVDGVLQKKKVIPEEDGAQIVQKGDVPENDIVQKGDEIGFRSIDRLGENAKFNRSYVNSLTGFSDNIASLASKHNLSVDDFKLLQQKRYNLSEMSAVEMSKIDAIRNEIPLPDGNTILQKVLPKKDIQKYLDGDYSAVGGFVTTAKDAKHLSNFEDVFYGMRLDYNGTLFNLSDGSFGVIRYKTLTPNASVPKLPTTSGQAPYTGNGFTGGNNGRLGVPEWKTPYNTPNEGAELWEVSSDGTETLRAVFNSKENRFIELP